MQETPTRELPVVRETAETPERRESEALNRFVALVEAVGFHEAATSRTAVPRRPADHALYQTLDRVQGLEAGPPGGGPR